MTLTSEQLKKIATEHIKKEYPELKDVEPTIQEEERSIPQKVERKLGLEHPKKNTYKCKGIYFQENCNC
jgi:hypothetical protein